MKKHKTVDWQTYEEVVKYIYESLGKDKGVTIECYGRNCKVKGKSGIEHQIDVLTNHSDGLHIYKTAIECKYWDQKIDKDTIMKVAAIIEDAGINKGIIVSKLGFTPDTIEFAKYKNIGLVELREPTEEDWKGRIKDIVININIMVPQITRMDFIVDKVEDNARISSLYIDKYIIKNKDGSLESVGSFAKEFHSELSKQEYEKEFSKVYQTKEGAVLTDSTPDLNLKIKGIKLTGVMRTGKETVEIKGEDHIWLIMKSIFEDKRFAISKNGDISEKK